MGINKKLDAFRTCFDDAPQAFALFRVAQTRDEPLCAELVYANPALAALLDTPQDSLCQKGAGGLFGGELTAWSKRLHAALSAGRSECASLRHAGRTLRVQYYPAFEAHCGCLFSEQAGTAACAWDRAYLARVSHQLRTPMNNVLGFMELAASYIHEPERAKTFLTSASASARGLMLRIGDLLDLAYLKSNGQRLRAEPLDIPAFVAAELDPACRLIAREKGASYDRCIQTEAAGVYSGDAEQLRRILVPLVTAAAACTDSGGRLALYVRRLSDGEGWARLCFDVQCTGRPPQGVEPERLFEPFAWEAWPARPEKPDPGLRLAVARELIQAMEGSLSVCVLPEGNMEWTAELRLDVPQKAADR